MGGQTVRRAKSGFGKNWHAGHLKMFGETNMHILEGLSRLTDGSAASTAEQTQYGNAPHLEAQEYVDRLIARLQHEELEKKTREVHVLWQRRQPDCPPWRRL